MKTSLKTAPLAGILFFGAGIWAHADTFTFDFNTGLSAGNTNATIATYMTNQLVAQGCVGCSVTISGGAIVDTTYDGDDHVVGTSSKSLTLGTSDGAIDNTVAPRSTYDNFIANTSNSGSQQSDHFSIKFTGLSISSVSFDFEVFPDGACTQLNNGNCGGAPTGGIYPNQPDLMFKAGNGTTETLVSAFGTGGIQYGVAPGGLNGANKTSPLSNNEKTPQWIGTFSGNLPNVIQLDFYDWPATIAIDNLSVSRSAVPEPGSIVLLGTGLVALFTVARNKRKA